MYKMETYCLKCRKYTENINLQVSSTSNGKIMILSRCTICNTKKCRFIKKQEAKRLISKLGNTNTRWYFIVNAIPLKYNKTNEIDNKF